MQVHNRKARKQFDCRKCDKPIKPGEQYFTFQHKGSKPTRWHAEHGRPRQSELCTGKMSGVYAAVENIEDAVAAARASNDPEPLAGVLREAAESVEEVRQEYEDSRSNMPEHLQDTGTGAEMQEKIDALEEFKNSLESAADDIEGETVPEEPESPGVDHAEDCPENPDYDKDNGDETECNCGLTDAENVYADWENSIEEIITKAEDAAQELSI